jgi:hypothetical protein
MLRETLNVVIIYVHILVPFLLLIRAHSTSHLARCIKEG